MVTIWGRPSCSFCEKAKQLCEQYAIKYEYILIDGPEKLEELRELVPDARTVPQIFWNGNYIGGYSEFSLEVENTRNFGQEKI